MKKPSHFTFLRAIFLSCSVLLCTVPNPLKADESIDTTVQRLDAAANEAGNAKTTAEISTKFTTLAGSAANASALVTGLHEGTTVTLTTTVNNQASTIEFQPTSGQLSYGNTFISLALAQESLVKAGITQPTADQLVAALNGGVVTGGHGGAVAMAGVLTLRAAGSGWGDIAQTLGVKLDSVIQNLNAVHQRIAANPAR